MDIASAGQAAKVGLVVVGPILFLVGTGFALSTTVSSFYHPVPKLLGWIGGMPFAFVTGRLLTDHLTPFFWWEFGMGWNAGYGWGVAWVAVSIFGRVNDEIPLKSEEPRRPRFGGKKRTKNTDRTSSGAAPLRFRNPDQIKGDRR